VSDKEKVLEANDRFLEQEAEHKNIVTPDKDDQQQIENVVISNIKQRPAPPDLSCRKPSISYTVAKKDAEEEIEPEESKQSDFSLTSFEVPDTDRQ